MSDESMETTGTTKTGGLAFNLAAAACYLPISPINLIASVLWIATEPKESRFVRFNAFQSLIWMFGGGFGLGVVVSVLSIVFGVVSGLGILPDSLVLIASLLLMLVDLLVIAVFFLVTLFAMYKAFSGQVFRLPVIGGLAERFAG